ncbi:type III-B CRISPR module RAMP protein Cmr1 [Myxococcus sp. CA033]|uniref:type III-B CRISPR module RAMP protein Cmr1 n=1 Tax=Myxococcus sp. CA033 TaxID=2741516 RepID=UPI00157A3DD8|nr:type III-B CRISPR module RAMP protein Cmr1 [Myxococcus sp. CA033]NTX41320.1 type III-B CRISPR module RAMP protein Cmr1 [Myxococcus sp. CA033]
MPPLNLPTPSKDPSPGRRLPGGPRLESFTLELKTVTPILGGGPVTRQLSDVDIIRVPTLRGHLRFWWRALYGYSYADEGDDARLAFARKERELWGGMGLGEEEPRRSQVELSVRDVHDAVMDSSDISLGEAQSYALWPARKTREEDPAPRWKPGLRFILEVRAPEGEAMLQVRNAFRAWLLFDGYGSRTRRGCGAVTLVSSEARQGWLPKNASRAELRRLFGDLPLFQPELSRERRDLPLLRGARLYRNLKGEASPDANNAWLEALGWLREFRQGTHGAQGERPRNPSPVGDNRAGRSNWPEADKIRHHARPSKPGPDPRAYPEEHAPRSAYPRTPVWPRAGFGLPIVFHFQQKQRGTKESYSRLEPEKVQLQWMTNRGDVRDRLGSPLIVKAMPLANGRFEPIALWMERGYPTGGQVVLMQGGNPLDATRADFDKLAAEHDQPLFNPLRRSKSLREAFFTWLGDTRKAREA